MWCGARARALVAPFGPLSAAQADITDDAAIAALELGAGAELVTISYCLTMIPAWKEALEKIVSQVLAPGGFPGARRLHRQGRRRRPTAEQGVLRRWFALDAVFFDRTHVDWLESRLTTTFYHESAARVPYTPLYPTHYIFVGRKPTLA